CGAMLAQRKAAHVASEVGDLVAQCQTVADADFPTSGNGGFFAVGGDVVYPLSTSTLSMRITSVNAASTASTFKVGWSYDNGGSLTKYTKGNSITNSKFSSLIPANGSIIMAESRYTYNSPVNIMVKNAMTFDSVFYLTPRQVTTIPQTG